MSKQVLIKRSIISDVLKFIFIMFIPFVIRMSFRFHLGRPMNGKTIDNSTLLKGATHGKPGRVLTRWQKKPQIHRGLIRAGVFWPIVGLIALTIYNVRYALLVLAFSLFPLGFLLFIKGRLIFFDPFSSTDAANGARTQHWTLKNKWRKLFRMQPIPGKLTWKERHSSALPPEIQAALKPPPKAPRYRRT